MLCFIVLKSGESEKGMAGLIGCGCCYCCAVYFLHPPTPNAYIANMLGLLLINGIFLNEPNKCFEM